VISSPAPVVTITKLVGGQNNAVTNVTTTINIPSGSISNTKSVNVSFTEGDCVQIQTTTSAGGGGGNSRISLTFQTIGSYSQPTCMINLFFFYLILFFLI
jgi:hypothetical protein